jgi:hypothetical protein
LNIAVVLLIVAVAVVVAVEIGVLLMKSVLSSDPEHHSRRSPAARVIVYVVCALVLIAFTTLATGLRPWLIAALIVLIPIVFLATYRKQ